MLSINWEITRKCNLDCIYCRVSGGETKKNELSFEQAKNAVRKLAKAGYSHIKFTGGEPLLKDFFWRLVEYAHKHKILVSVFTNATLISDKNIPLFKKYIASVAVSLDSLDEEQNKKLKRSKATHIIKKIEMLKDAHIHTVISSTITKINIEEISTLIGLARILKIKEIKLNDFVVNGRANSNKKLLELPQPLKNQINDIKAAIKEEFNETARYDRCFKCECSNNDLFIGYKGDVYPCVELVYRSNKFCLGNINGNFKKILNINREFCSHINKIDMCGYSYLSSPHISACLNRNSCPKTLFGYMKKAKNYGWQ